MAVVFAGCVVSDPPENGIAKQTPPFLDLNGASPPIFKRVDANTGGPPIKFSVPVRSEDANDQLVGILMLNKNVVVGGISIEQQLNFGYLAPGSLDDETKRELSVEWSVNRPKGCYQISLVVTHQSNLQGNQPVRDEDTAYATWWVNVDDDGKTLFQDCPLSLGGSN